MEDGLLGCEKACRVLLCVRAQGSDCVFCAGRGLEERDGQYDGET